MSRLKKVSGLPYKIVIESEHTRFLLLTRSTSEEGYCLRIKREARKIAECTSYTSCVLLSFSSRGNIVWETQTHIHAYAHTCILTTAAAAVAAKECSRLPLPLRRLTSKHALILPLVYGHVVWLTKCISPWFHCPLSGGRRPTLYFTVFWVVGRRPTPSTEWFLFHRPLSGLLAAHTFFWVIPTTPTPTWRWFHGVGCGCCRVLQCVAVCCSVL